MDRAAGDLAARRHGPYAPPEYIIVWKVAYFAEGGGEKHSRDIRRMREISADEIDDAILHAELERRQLLASYHQIVGSSA